MKIAVYDSGVGGLGAFGALAKLQIADELIYHADLKNVPYGEKSAEILRCIVRENVTYLFSLGVDFIVVACNTACTALQDETSSKIVKIIDFTRELAQSAPKNTLLLCTQASLNSQLLCAPKDGFIAAAPELVRSCQSAEFNKSAEQIAQIKRRFCGVENIIAGCTHFGLLRAEFEQNGLKLLDPVELLASRFCTEFARQDSCKLVFLQPQMQAFYEENLCRF